jgi:hypothetical protein
MIKAGRLPVPAVYAAVVVLLLRLFSVDSTEEIFVYSTSVHFNMCSFCCKENV